MQQTPAAPTPPAAPPAPTANQVVVGQEGLVSNSPSAVLEGLRNQRRELRDQLDQVGSTRRSVREQLRSESVTEVEKKGLEQRLTELDARISSLDKQIAEADARVATAAAVPGAVVERRDPPRDGPPEEAFVMGGIFMIITLLPLSIAYARRIWRRAAVISTIPVELYDRLSRIEQGVEATAVEVERIGEGQRFVTRVFSENTDARILAAGAAQEIPVNQREAEAVRR